MCGNNKGHEIDVGHGYHSFTDSDIVQCMLVAEQVCGTENDEDDEPAACSECIDRHAVELSQSKCDDTNQDGSIDATDRMLSSFCDLSNCVPLLVKSSKCVCNITPLIR